MDLSPPIGATVADRYVVERELGRGGMATVYLAHDRKHDAPVALKVLHADLAPLVGGERFAREIRITAGLQHPHILPVLDSGEADGLPYYTMPYVEGETLAARLRRERPLPLDLALRVAAEVAEALDYAHARGFVHRDVKPENIMLTGYPTGSQSPAGGWHALVLDFGIARAVDGASVGASAERAGRRLTESGVSVGTVLYMSPEQAAGDDVDGRSDVYALGCVLYEMLTGQPPFTGVSARVILARHAIDPPPGLRAARPTAGPAIEGVVARAMAKAPADRYATAGAFREALLAAAAEDAGRPAGAAPGATPNGVPRGPLGVLPNGSPGETPNGSHVGARAGAGAAGRAPAAGRRRLALAGAAALALGAAALAAWRAGGAGAAGLDPHRVTVFPLVAFGAGALGTSRAAGEDVATVIGSALDRAGPLRWVDGWRLLDAAGRADPRALTPDAAAALARAQRSRYYLTGRLAPRGDSVEVVVELNDAARDAGDTAAVVARASARGLAAEPWRAGLRALNRLLPRLVPGAPGDVSAEWEAREPAAVAHFLLGEAAFRRVHPGEALAEYRAAVAADSGFALAAVRGAQAATWNHRGAEAAALIRVALARPMPPREAHFARGYAAYVEGRPDSAAREFRRALDADPDMAAAWVQTGETYTHLLPASGRPDSLADDAFAHALALDAAAAQVLLHPIESRLRRGDAAGAAPLVRRFLAADPDSTLAAQVRVMDACVRGGPAAVDWRQQVAAHAPAVLYAAQSLAAAGAQLPCAEAAYAALRTHETPAMAAADPGVFDRRWTALVGLQGVLLARGRDATAAALVDSAIARKEGGVSLLLVEAPLAPAFATRGRAAALRDSAQRGADCGSCKSERVWQLGVWAAHANEAGKLALLTRAASARADSSRTPADSLMARATAARAALARGDTAAAMAGYAAVLAGPWPAGGDLTWTSVPPRNAERLEYARLLLAGRAFARALDVADVFDSPASQSSVAYLPASLTLRAAAADAAGDRARGDRYRARLSALGVTRPVAARE